jgi:hypothetical protein
VSIRVAPGRWVQILISQFKDSMPAAVIRMSPRIDESQIGWMVARLLAETLAAREEDGNAQRVLALAEELVRERLR